MPAMTRRSILQLLGSSALVCGAGGTLSAFAQIAEPEHAAAKKTTAGGFTLNTQQSEFLEDMKQRACLYFWEQASSKTGQVRDRARATGQENQRFQASTAATGFGLTALCIAHKHDYLPAAEVIERVRTTLRYHSEVLPQVHGFYYHFNHMETGARSWKCELSSIDTALLLCGVLMARSYFKQDAEIVQYATKIYERVDWPWMLNGGKTFSMGWTPESGFLEARWNQYCELMMIYLLAIGSPTHPVPAQLWNNFSRPTVSYAGLRYIGGNTPLFTHMYSHAWFDFRYKHDAYADYFGNSILATKAHKEFCLSLRKRFPEYSEDYWGISASDSEAGYQAWGGPPVQGSIDGSVVPYATAGALPFLPADCLRVLLALKKNSLAWGRYGFVDAFHPQVKWYDQDVLGIDQGISLLMAENLCNGFVWETFMRNPEIAMAMHSVGL